MGVCVCVCVRICGGEVIIMMVVFGVSPLDRVGLREEDLV